jgi:predicted secreted protein
MFFIIIFGVWYAIIGSLIFSYNWQSKPEPSNYWLWVDRYVFFSLGGLYIISHIILLIWFVIVPFGSRRQMRNKDLTYRKLLAGYTIQRQQSVITYASQTDYNL